MSERPFALGDHVRIVGPVVESSYGDDDLIGETGVLRRERKYVRPGDGRWVVGSPDEGECYAFVDEGSIEHVEREGDGDG